jgi:hypothetical protein
MSAKLKAMKDGKSDDDFEKNSVFVGGSAALKYAEKDRLTDA